MKRSLILFIAAVGLFTVSCSTKNAEKVADEFHQKLDSEEYDYIVDNLADLEEDVTKDDWHGFLAIVDGWGPQSNRKKKSGFSKKTSDGATTVKLSYTFEIAEIGLVYERIVLINRGEDYKIRTVIMNSDEEVVIEATKEF